MEVSNEAPEAKPVIYPSPEWREAFRAQLIPSVMERAIAAVDALLEGPDGWWSGTSADDLVHDAIVATGRGEISWRPDRVRLWVHLRDRARAQLRRERVRAMREVNLDQDDDESAEAMVIERDHLAVTPDLPSAIDLHRSMQAEEARLWQAAAGDQGVLAVMNARSQGHVDSIAIGRASGLTVAEVAAARRRLGRLARRTAPISVVLAS